MPVGDKLHTDTVYWCRYTIGYTDTDTVYWCRYTVGYTDTDTVYLCRYTVGYTDTDTVYWCRYTIGYTDTDTMYWCQCRIGDTLCSGTNSGCVHTHTYRSDARDVWYLIAVILFPFCIFCLVFVSSFLPIPIVLSVLSCFC